MRKERLIIHASENGLTLIRVLFPTDRREAALQLFGRAWPTLAFLDRQVASAVHDVAPENRHAGEFSTRPSDAGGTR
jgi:hypothetical protein